MKKSRKGGKKEQKAEAAPVRAEVGTGTVKNILLQFDDFAEEYPAVEIGECISESRELLVRKLVKLLERNYNICLLNKEVKFFLEDGGVWLLCPKARMAVPEHDYLPFPTLTLSLRVGKEYIEAIMEQSDSQSESQDNSEEEEWDKDLKCRRLKERKIKHVIEKVLRWRELYAGIGVREKVALEEGAKIVNISKKTLDDYLSQIKKGRRYGFNFNEHKNEKIGILREFIRKAEKHKK